MYLSQEEGTDSLVTFVQQKAPRATDCTGLYTTRVTHPALFFYPFSFASFHMMLNHNAVTLDMILMSANKCFISVHCRDFVTEY